MTSCALRARRRTPRCREARGRVGPGLRPPGVLRNHEHIAIIPGMTRRPFHPVIPIRLRMLLVTLLCAPGVTTVQAGEVQGHLETHRFHSEVFGETRTLLVWVPADHAADPDHPLPLLLALQGENLFDADQAAGGAEWAVDELLSRSPAGIPQFLVVGLVSAPNAVREYATPGSRPDAQAADLMRCLLDEVLPYVQEHWTLEPEATSHYLMGMNLSAWAAVYGAWAHTSVFGGALAFDFPDVDAEQARWAQAPPEAPRPWLWLEQTTAERSRNSNSTLLSWLRASGEANVVVAGPTASRPTRLAAALRATPRATFEAPQESGGTSR